MKMKVASLNETKMIAENFAKTIKSIINSHEQNSKKYVFTWFYSC